MTTLSPRSPILRQNIVVLSKAFAKARGIKLSTLSRLIRGDMYFLRDYSSGKISVTIKKYDEIIEYFVKHWPANTPMPKLELYD
jgi:hypothetical protein